MRSAAVRSATSIRNGRRSRREPGEDPRIEHRAEVVGVRDEGVAVARVEQRLEHPRGHRARCRGRRGRAAPTPAPGRPATRPGVEVVDAQLGHLVLDEVDRQVGRQVVVARRAPPASRRGSRSEFISTSGSRAPLRSRRSSTCSAIRSRKLRPSLTSSSDLALVMPIDVPSPPLSLMTTAWSSSPARRLGPAARRVGQLDDRLDVGLGQRPRLARAQPLVLAREASRPRRRRALRRASWPTLASQPVARAAQTYCPGAPVAALLGRQLVDLDAERGELEPRDLAVDVVGHRRARRGPSVAVAAARGARPPAPASRRTGP